MLHTYCDVVEQITVRLAPYVAIATNPRPSCLRHAAFSCLNNRVPLLHLLLLSVMTIKLIKLIE